MRVKSTIILSLITILLTACDSGSESKKPLNKLDAAAYSTQNEANTPSVASVGDSSISLDVLRYYLARRGYGANNKTIDKDALRSVLDEIITLELYKQAAIKNNLDKNPETVLSMTQILASKYQTDILAVNTNLTQISAEKIRQRFEENKEQYKTPARRRAALISVHINSKPTAEELKQAEAKIKSAIKDAGSLKKDEKLLGNLAEKYSDDTVSKSRRGDIGWVVEGASISRYEPAVITSLYSLKEVGNVSSLVKGERGYYLVKLVDLKPAEQQTLEQVERAVHKTLLSEKRRVVETQIIKDLNEQFKVSINDAALNDFVTKVNTKNTDADNKPPSFPVSVETK